MGNKIILVIGVLLQAAVIFAGVEKANFFFFIGGIVGVIYFTSMYLVGRGRTSLILLVATGVFLVLGLLQAFLR